ncbi:DUF4876 domain-containing protein [Dyadobacter sp. LHD-138]|uniref:DUF4876 domain-containing protein n=1 Tax=Dyadobacter sp. LHD-138 TaxID=3071413 RepID=UPI0027DF4642|nr:DUF4876 domain-containing protein [Dyadobacter sp. LHD-138]MDQ6481841.1 DUF4876 domain-containing protein [Dyadobacter sp. LHD-138]
MKKITLFFAAMVALGAAFVGCKDSDGVGPVTVGYQITVKYPGAYKDKVAVNAEVTLTNAVTGSTTKVSTSETGVANFVDILPGTYQVSVKKDLTAAESVVQTGIESEVYLNAALINHTIQASGATEIQLIGSKVGGLVFKEIYFTGSPDFYFYDQFYEIYNNSTDTLFADSLCIGDVAGNPWLSSASKPSGFQNDKDYTYLQNVWMIPGTGKSVPVAPGKSIIVAETGINHKTDPLGNPQSPVNLGKGTADFESYVATSNRDIDNPDVPNLVQIYWGAGTLFDWLTPVVGPSMVIFKHKAPASLALVTEPNSTSTKKYVQVPVASVIDAVDILANEGAGAFKRLPSALDAGFKYCTGTYNKESVRRKVKTTLNGRRVLQDSNNSTNDFEVIATPTPKGW